MELSSATKVYYETLKIEFWDCKDLNGLPFKVIDPNSKGRFEMALNMLAKSAKFEKDYKERSKKWKKFFDLKEVFVDVKYIYASTIHKLQGSTYETVYIDLREIEKMSDKDMMYRLLYVAITRASKDVKVLLPNNENEELSQYQNSVLNSLDLEFKNLAIDL